MNKEDVLIIVTGIIILIVIIALSFFIPEEAKGVKVITDDNSYSAGEDLKIKIDNDSNDKICFSSCYPYYFEKKVGDWTGYKYQECPKENIVEECIDPKNVKAFAIKIPFIGKGIHRIVLPACVGCVWNSLFNEEERFYSNEFIIE